MTKVFIGGSRRISRLTEDVSARLQRIVDRGFAVLVGDANGADKAVQLYLNGKGYRNVVVFCSGEACRNNVGNWPKHRVETNSRKRDRAFFTMKDRAMTNEATVGFMLWDGQSLGTLRNIARLLRQDKPTVVYNAPEHAFLEVRTQTDWQGLLMMCPDSVRQKFGQEDAPENLAVRQPAQASFW